MWHVYTFQLLLLYFLETALSSQSWFLLQRMVPAFLTSCTDSIKRWDQLVGTEGSYELDVWPEFQSLTGDAISRTAFGSSYEEREEDFRTRK